MINSSVWFVICDFNCLTSINNEAIIATNIISIDIVLILMMMGNSGTSRKSDSMKTNLSYIIKTQRQGKKKSRQSRKSENGTIEPTWSKLPIPSLQRGKDSSTP